jgi:transcriptional regulator with XRE-family HTH domain
MIWTTPAVIRARREQIGLSQSDLAAQLGVTKSLLSLIESGKRGPTEEQLTILARVLELPAELLQLGTGRMPDDVRSAFLADAAGTVAAVRARTEARVVAAPQFPSHIGLVVQMMLKVYF